MDALDWEVLVLGGNAAIEPVGPPGAGAGAGSYGTPQITCSTAEVQSWQSTFRRRLTCEHGVQLHRRFNCRAWSQTKRFYQRVA